MNRPWAIWTLFAVCLVLALAALAGGTRLALDLDRQREAAREQAELSKAVRLALYRMDTALAPALAAEALRPPETNHNAESRDEAPATFPFVEARFIAYDTAPATPSSAAGEKHSEGTFVVTPAFLERLQKTEASMGEAASLPPWGSGSELDIRVQSVSAGISNVMSSHVFIPERRPGLMVPLWDGDVLYLARRIAMGDATGVQAYRLDWPRLEAHLLERVKDLLPEARLEPLREDVGHDSETRLAALPVALKPGLLPASEGVGTTPLRLGLATAWAGTLVSIVALGVVIGAALSLSERRAAFVSAVTHELRTPLTTFRLYSDLLAEGLISDEARRQQYYETLRKEAVRLGHLVENVLAYARLERRPDADSPTIMPLEKALDNVLETLGASCEHAGRTLQVDLDVETRNTFVRVDPAGLERILTNLVDNACKHGVPFTEPTIHFRGRREASWLVLEVQDRGPGMPAGRLRGFLRPFARPASASAGCGPGIGLGLALSQRLACRMGAKLDFGRSEERGARVTLRLMVAGAGHHSGDVERSSPQ